MVTAFSTGAPQHPGFLAMEEQARLHLEDEIFNAVTNSPYPRLELAKIARWNGVSPEVMENTAQSVIQRRTGQDLEQVEFHQVVKAVQRLELEEPDQGMREWKLQGLARRLRRTPRQIMDAYNKALCTQQPVKPMHISEFRANQTDEIEWLLQGWIPKGTTVLLHADGGIGKTLFVYQLLQSIIQGKPWNGYQVQQGAALLVQVDEPELVTAERMDIRGIRDTDPLYLLADWQVEAMARLESYIAETLPAIVVVDSLTAINRSCCFSENDTEYARPVLQLANIASRYGCTVLIIHHSNAEGKSRGTRAIYNSVSEVWGMTAADNGDRILHVQKTRLGRPPGRYKFAFDDDDFSFAYIGEDNGSEDYGESAANLEEKVRLWLSEPDQRGIRFSSTEVSEFLDVTRHSARRSCYELWAKGLVKRVRPKGEKAYLYYCPSGQPSDPSDPSDPTVGSLGSLELPAPDIGFSASDPSDPSDPCFLKNSRIVNFSKKADHLDHLDHLEANPIEGSASSNCHNVIRDLAQPDHLPLFEPEKPLFDPADHLADHLTDHLPVTSLNTADEVVLVGEAVKICSTAEIKEVWTVRSAGAKWVKVFSADLGDRKFPVAWLKVLRSANSPYT
jgi:hypothetical protein